MYRNIRLFGVYKVFTKRVFLPLTTIYASQVAGLSVAEIGTTTAAGLVASLTFETTTGSWADKHGRRNSARTGALLACIATLMYVFFPSFGGILLASVIIAMGYSFLSGSMDAPIHDSLVVLKPNRRLRKDCVESAVTEPHHQRLDHCTDTIALSDRRAPAVCCRGTGVPSAVFARIAPHRAARPS